MGEESEVDAVEVVRHQEHFLQDSKPTLAEGSFLFFLQLLLDFGDLFDDMMVVDGEASDSCEVGGCFVVLANFNEVARGFVVEEGKDEYQTGEHNMDCGWYNLSFCQPFKKSWTS